MTLYTRYTMWQLKLMSRYFENLGHLDVAQMMRDEEYQAIIWAWTEKHNIVGSWFHLFTVSKEFRSFCRKLWDFGEKWARRPISFTYRF